MDETANKKKNMPKLWGYWYLIAILLIFSGNAFAFFISVIIISWLGYRTLRLGREAFKPIIKLDFLEKFKDGAKKPILAQHTSFKPIIKLNFLDKLKNEAKKPIPVQYTLAEIDAMDGYEFEKYIKHVFEDLGYSVHHTPPSGDQGADLILTSNEGIKTAVQVKRYSGKVSNSAVQEVVAAKAFYKSTQSMVVTNSYFTDHAIQLARANDVNLVDRIGLTNLLNKSFNSTNGKQRNFIDGLKTGYYLALSKKK